MADDLQFLPSPPTPKNCVPADAAPSTTGTFNPEGSPPPPGTVPDLDTPTGPAVD